MKKAFKVFSLSIICWFILPATSLSAGGNDQPKSDPSLFTFGSEEVKLSEFQYVYNKNNMNDTNSYSKESLEESLELYINFRLKVKEAEEQGLDTVKAINDELETYRKQLAKSYLYDREVSDKLLEEAYERMQYEVRASHILFKLDESALPADTLEAYNQAIKVRKKLLAGESFEKLADQHSADPSVKNNKGDIGYFTAFQTVYPFESAAYSTEKGKISLPVRTRFGYHLVKVTDKRPARGTIKVAHILVKIPQNPELEHEQKAQDKINGIYERLKNNEPFEQVAQEVSEDKLSAKNGGVLPEFSTGKMVQQFEDAAFSLMKDGDFSQPVRTEFGYHIIKRISRSDILPYADMKGELKKKVEKDSRSAIARNVLVDRIRKENKFQEFPKAKDELYKKIGDELTKGKFVMGDKSNLEQPLFVLAGSNYTQAQFVEFLEKNQNKKRDSPSLVIYNDYYHQFVEQTCLDYEESQLEKKYPEFKALMKEYHDGILLFELTDQKVWSKAIKDTLGLAAYHDANKTDYMWGERAKVVIYTAKNEAIAKSAKKLIKKGKLDNAAILAKLNTEEGNLKATEEGIFEKGQNEVVDKHEWMAGISENTVNGDGTITFVKFNEIRKPEPKLLNEAKGFIVSDSQEYLEKQWIKELRTKYPVHVQTEVFNSLIK